MRNAFTLTYTNRWEVGIGFAKYPRFEFSPITLIEFVHGVGFYYRYVIGYSYIIYDVL